MSSASETKTRFEAFISPEPNTGCWLWMGSINRHGYGQFRTDRMDTAHRVAYRLYRDPIPQGMHVLHQCDVTACVNPAHLRLGTHQENMADRAARKTGSRGAKVRTVKLTEDQVRQIRLEVSQGASITGVAREYGVVRTTIQDVVHRRSWTHI